MSWLLIGFALANLGVGVGAAVYLGFVPVDGLGRRARAFWEVRRAWSTAMRARLWAGGSFFQGFSWLFHRWSDEVIILAQRAWEMVRRRSAAPQSESPASLPISRLLEPFDHLRETLASLDARLAASAAETAPEELLRYRETIEIAHQRWIEAGQNAAQQLQEARGTALLPEETASSLQSAIHEHLEALQTLLVDLAELDASKPLRARAILRGSLVSTLELSQDLIDRLLGTLAAHDQTQRPAALPAAEQRDPLTGLANLRGLESWLQPRRARPTASQGLAGVLVYVDRLEAVNRRWGVHVGDRVLIEVARLVRKSARPPRLAARICGPQFLLLLPIHSLASAQRLAEQLRRKIEALQLTGMHDPPRITATCLAALCDATQPADSMVRLLHRALYERENDQPNQTWVLEEGKTRLVSPPASQAAAHTATRT